MVTGDCADASTEAAVTIQLVGSDGLSLPVPLTAHIWLPPHDNSARLKPKFSRNQVRVKPQRGEHARSSSWVECS
jgi:hypothetical protein